MCYKINAKYIYKPCNPSHRMELFKKSPNRSGIFCVQGTGLLKGSVEGGVGYSPTWI